MEREKNEGDKSTQRAGKYSDINPFFFFSLYFTSLFSIRTMANAILPKCSRLAVLAVERHPHLLLSNYV